MSDTMHALVLTGDVRPGFDAQAVWPKLAELFRIDARRMHDDVLARAPITVKQGADAASLQTVQAGAEAIGAVAQIHPIGADGSVFVLIDNVPRGPVPRSFVAARVQSGIWPTGVLVAAVGSNAWQAFAESTPSFAPPAPSSPGPAQATVWNIDADAIDGPLPPGPAVHAGFWRRCGAYMLDSLILFLPSMFVTVIPLLGLLMLFAGRWLYYALMESSNWQATLGKRAFGIKVTDDAGRRVSFGIATGRYFGAAISNMILYVGYMLAGWTARKQALHDLMAGTCVVFDGVQPGRAMPTVRPPMPWYGWVLNIVPLAIVPISILAAIALPAYQDYITRSKVAAIVVETGALRVEISEQALFGDGCPNGTREPSSPLIQSVELSGSAPNCVATFTISGDSSLPSSIRGHRIIWSSSGSAASNNLDWTCTSSLDSRRLPARCR